MRICAFVLLLTLPISAAPQKTVRQREVKIQKTSLSRDQEIQLGKEAAAQVENTMEVVKNPTVEAWLNRIGQKLAATREANAYPYYFKLINDDSINAFALPGGPMYVHTGLIKAADSESQVAGVLAHEMSHVALRHGAAQMSKAQMWQGILGLGGAAAGALTGGGLLGQAIQLGGGIGVGGLLSKFSRDYERDADLNGARMMASAGYNPIDLAVFFERLEAEMGSAAKPRGLDAFLSDHPAPGSRRTYIEEDVQFYPKKTYDAQTGEFARVKQLVASLPPPKKKPAASLQPVKAQARQGLPEGFKDLRTAGFSIAFPNDWRAGTGKQGPGIYVVPQGGAVQQQNGGIELIAGAMIDYYRSQNSDLGAATLELLATLKKGDPAMNVEPSQKTQVGSKPAMVTKLTTKTSYAADPEQIVYLYTVAREEGLFNIALAWPQSTAAKALPVFKQIVETVQFPD